MLLIYVNVYALAGEMSDCVASRRYSHNDKRKFDCFFISHRAVVHHIQMPMYISGQRESKRDMT